MAEVQKSTNAGESAQRFIEFVMMQAQNASLFLGLIPNPQTGKGEVNLELARLFIDQLGMIQEKTRGNLSNDETNVLRNALSNLQMAFFEVSQGGGLPEEDDDTLTSGGRGAQEEPASASSEREMASPTEPPAPAASAPPEEDRGESKKRFTKSYGA